jgi:hypothetical protein
MHYVCIGTCHGLALEPGLCVEEDCTKQGEDLIECDCTDGAHDELSEEAEESEE